ncbi:MAG: two-component sensor histidine kinase [Herbinix sp.]|nr:two-component sensor histidine kinase [Herbinix sp.]
MFEIIDKILLFLCCMTLYLLHFDIYYAIIPMLIVVLYSSLFVYFDHLKIKVIGTILFFLLCTFFPNFFLFLPLILYDILTTKYQYYGLLALLLPIINTMENSQTLISFTSVFFVIAYLLKYKTVQLYHLKTDYNELRDTTAEFSMLLEEKNQSLIKNQDYEINMATLNERNRISKEIHDNIGHLLSRSLLQIGALLTITREEGTKEGLLLLKESLSGGMDQIRNTIHHMYDESIDLYAQVNQLIGDFTFCPANLDYDIRTNPPILLKYSFVAIIKEALANIMKHSNASKVSVMVREHPGMYQLVIKDNGTLSEDKILKLQRNTENKEFSDGMGLRNISDRVKGLRGNLNISVEHGFQIFITIPK